MPSAVAEDLSTTTEVSVAPSKDTAIEDTGLVKDATLEATTVEGAHTAILNRIPWRPPVAVRGEGVFFDLEDGTRIIDGVGGAAVSCLGSNHPKVVEAITEQLQKLICV